jgi:hypothetical protein
VVLLGLVRLDGVVGGVVSTVPPASHEAPLRRQLAGVTPPGAPTQPKLVLAPTASVAFQVPTAVTWLPLRVRLASHDDEIVAPVGRSNSTRHVSGAEEPLTIVYLPSYPVPQSDDRVNVADAPLAAYAAVDTGARATARAATAAIRRAFRIGRLMRVSRLNS